MAESLPLSFRVATPLPLVVMSPKVLFARAASFESLSVTLKVNSLVESVSFPASSFLNSQVAGFLRSVRQIFNRKNLSFGEIATNIAIIFRNEAILSDRG